jgi:hypothetical protein
MSQVAVPTTFHTVMGVRTNLTPELFTEVVKAVEEKRVDWDDRDTHVSDGFAAGDGHSEGQFVYNGHRYLWTENFEKLDSLTRI